MKIFLDCSHFFFIRHSIIQFTLVLLIYDALIFCLCRNMPDIDTLMQEWPPEFEELLNQVELLIRDLVHLCGTGV